MPRNGTGKGAGIGMRPRRGGPGTRNSEGWRSNARPRLRADPGSVIMGASRRAVGDRARDSRIRCRLRSLFITMTPLVVHCVLSRVVDPRSHESFGFRGRDAIIPVFRCPSAGWQSGYAAACKAVYAGSIPTPASISFRITLSVRLQCRCRCLSHARVAEQVDAGDLKSPGFGRAGSSPAPGTIPSQDLGV